MLGLASYSVMVGHSASKDARKRALVPAIHDLLSIRKALMPGNADKFTQSAQARLRAGHDDGVC
jgi:hypothetical protein